MPSQLTEKDMQRFAKGMTLAGEPLQPAVLHETGWRRGQTFCEQDDPDRMSLGVGIPDSISKCDPEERRESLKMTDVYRKGASFARIVEGVFTEKQCKELIAMTNKKGYTPALINVGRGRQMLEPDARDGHRVMSDMEPLANWFAEVMRDSVPRERKVGEFQGFNERMRFLCYTPGQSFPPHFDGCYRRPDGHPRAGDKSQITVMVYLHDVDPECGGATTLFPGTSEEVDVQPKAGSAFLFTQDIFHEGALVKKGLKYTIRTEAMYG